MKKLKITVEMDIPDDSFTGMVPEEIRLVVFDEYVNFVTTRHLKERIEWMAADKDMYPNAELIAEKHKNWGGSLRDGKIHRGDLKQWKTSTSTRKYPNSWGGGLWTGI